MTQTLTTALFPVAGLGRRLLPMTKAVSKELLPIGGLPIIQHAVNEARQAGITRFIFVAGENLPKLKSYFSPAPSLEKKLAAQKADEELKILRDLVIDDAIYLRQEDMLGLGHAIGCARDHIKEPFAVLLPDDLLVAQPGVLAQMIGAWEKTGGNMIALEEVPRQDCARYGIMDPVKRDGAIVRARGVVEKPPVDQAPSNLALIGRYILQPDIFEAIAQTRAGAVGEIQITDAIAAQIKTTKLYGFIYNGQRFDCGTRAAFAAAQKNFPA